MTEYSEHFIAACKVQLEKKANGLMTTMYGMSGEGSMADLGTFTGINYEQGANAILLTSTVVKPAFIAALTEPPVRPAFDTEDQISLGNVISAQNSIRYFDPEVPEMPNGHVLVAINIPVAVFISALGLTKVDTGPV